MAIAAVTIGQPAVGAEDIRFTGSLPDELVLFILSLFDSWKDLLRASHVCRRFYRLAHAKALQTPYFRLVNRLLQGSHRAEPFSTAVYSRNLDYRCFSDH
ncbi:MAG: F-box protein, partial [Chlamydiales bacterium]